MWWKPQWRIFVNLCPSFFLIPISHCKKNSGRSPLFVSFHICLPVFLPILLHCGWWYTVTALISSGRDTLWMGDLLRKWHLASWQCAFPKMCATKSGSLQPLPIPALLFYDDRNPQRMQQPQAHSDSQRAIYTAIKAEQKEVVCGLQLNVMQVWPSTVQNLWAQRQTYVG